MRKNLRVCNFIIVVVVFRIFSVPVAAYAQEADQAIFRDDFNRDVLGSFWEATPSWSIVNEAAYNFIDGVGGTLQTANSYGDSSYVIETSAKGFNSNYYRKFAITFGQASLANDSMYELIYTAYGGGRLTLYRSTDNVYYAEKLDEVAVYPALAADQWYSFKIARYKSGLIQVYIDQGAGYSKTPLLEAIDTGYQGLAHTGWRIDTETYAESFYVDWMAAARPSVEKPAIREKPSEDDLITQVSSSNGNSYKVSKLNIGSQAYADRDYTITSVPGYLAGASFIQTAMNDKTDTAALFLTSFLQKDAIVYIGYDPRATVLPEWLKGWTKTGDRIGITDPGSDYLDVYSKLFEYNQVYPFPLLLGGNLAMPAEGAKMNYIVAAVARPSIAPLQAEDAALSGAVIANNHINYSGTGFVDFLNPSDDYIEWTVDITVPGVYNLGFKYANASHTDRPLEISDNGLPIGSLLFSPLSVSWDSWGFVTGPDVYLSAGIHKIRVTATGSSGPNMDELSLFYTSSSPVYIAGNRPGLVAPVANSVTAPVAKAYPNPFGQATTIYFGLTQKAKVSLSVYSLQGQQMQLLIDDVREAGTYRAILNAEKFSPGVYIYRLQTGNQVQVGRLVKR